ncbi:hypothetical protein [Roseivivax marinus]|uniref:hypothetical protein n=1 Tax=Roseivivax marinus TaxID=1379903 RepID=UPI00273E19B6|nr:hypothetical protein [Roseivivax marinus]
MVDEDEADGTLQRRTVQMRLDDLMLDAENPRFGGVSGGFENQPDVLDHIVRKFGVDDVISSLAINGYFEAEPLVGRQDEPDGPVIVVEGNRRLAACLIIIGDQRASRQETRTKQYGEIWAKHGKPTIDPLPCIVFSGKDRRRALLSYLGVRHIASAQPWDSYAKAAWVARVVRENDLPLKDVAEMIGDRHQTIQRLLEGYYFIQQLIDEKAFLPENSNRRGRGSVTEYPFSWVYTLLGYSSAREFLELGDRAPHSKPVSAARLEDAGMVVKAMFGDAAKGRNAAIDDSRQLGELAKALSDEEKVRLLRGGRRLDEIEQLTKPIGERLRDGLAQVRDIQGELIKALSEADLDPELADKLAAPAQSNVRVGRDVLKRLRIYSGDHDDV